MATIRDVAAEARVSPATVSLVLNNSASKLRISEATCARVRAAAAKLLYRPNTYAKALRTNRSSTIGILAFDIVDLQNDESRLGGYVQLFREKRIEGLLILASSLQMEQGNIEELVKEHIPLVVIGRKVFQADVPTVVTDSRGGGYKAVRHLIDLGHRNIAFVLGPQSYVDSRLRRLGGEQALHDFGIPIRKDLVVTETASGWGPHAGYQATRRLLRTRRGDFTAVCAFDDISAFGTIRALAEAELRVPDDVSVVGFDDLSAAAFYNPPLTTIHYSMVGMGVRGARLLFEVIRANGQPNEWKNLVAETRLIVRKSTGPVPRKAHGGEGEKRGL